MKFMVMVSRKEGKRRFEYRADMRPRAWESARKLADKLASRPDQRAYLVPFGGTKIEYVSP